MMPAQTPRPLPRSAPLWFAAGPQLAVAGAGTLGHWSRETLLLTLFVVGGAALALGLWVWFREDRPRARAGS